MADPTTARDATSNGIPERLIDATLTLLATEGPSAIKARSVAAAAGMSTMVVYNYFGGVPELVKATVDHGFSQIEKVFAEVPVTEDPIADLFTMAVATLQYARANPHLYDLMFGLTTRATYRPSPDRDLRRSGRSPAFQAAFAHVTRAAARLAESEGAPEPPVMAAALWSFVHGYITLELGDHFSEFDDPLRQVMLPMGVTFAVGLGVDPVRARASHEAALARSFP